MLAVLCWAGSVVYNEANHLVDGQRENQEGAWAKQNLHEGVSSYQAPPHRIPLSNKVINGVTRSHHPHLSIAPPGNQATNTWAL